MFDSLERKGGPAQRGAWRRGFESGRKGEPRICPYRDKRVEGWSYSGMHTFSLSFINWWENGYDYGEAERMRGDCGV